MCAQFYNRKLSALFYYLVSFERSLSKHKRNSSCCCLVYALLYYFSRYQLVYTNPHHNNKSRSHQYTRTHIHLCMTGHYQTNRSTFYRLVKYTLFSVCTGNNLCYFSILISRYKKSKQQMRMYC